MPNKTYSLEWLDFAKRNLETARVLYDANHYTDIIAIEIHQTIEKSFKSILAYHGMKIPKTHDLMVLYEKCEQYKTIKTLTTEDLLITNDYYETERYPGPKYNIPSREEIKKNLNIAGEIYKQVSVYLNK